MLYYSKEQIVGLFDEHVNRDIIYQKRGTFLFRKAIPNETILTIVSGKLETMKAVAKDDVIMMNIEIGSSAEQYPITNESFAKRYIVTEKKHIINGIEWKSCQAIGQVHAFCYVGESITFQAPWDEQMILESGDWLASPVNGAVGDVYRIEKDTFSQTYTEKKYV